MSEENILINPDEVEKKKKRPSRTPEGNEEEKVTSKYFDKGSTIEIHYESQGRFSIPSTVYYKDFIVDQILKFSTSKSEHLLESILLALDKNKQSDTEFDFLDATPEEFLETLVGIKAMFNTPHHIHRYLCECQFDKSDEEQQVSEVTIHLGELQYKSIREIDQTFKEYIKEHLDKFTDEEYQDYLHSKYKNEPLDDIESWTKEKEVDSIKFNEPIHFHNPYDNNKYTFRLTRMRDMIDAQKIVSKKYLSKYSQIEKKPHPHGMPLAEFKEQKKAEIDFLKEEEGKELINYTKALSLIKINDEEIKSPQEKVSYYSELTRRAFFELIEFFNKVEYGVNHKINATCRFCGKTEERYLQRSLNPIELLPLDDDTVRKQGANTKLNIHFGV